ncbi:MAG: DUF493 domain-containing protein [Lysobacterales bacterium]
MASCLPPGKETLLEFPCRFPVKIIGHNVDDFEALVTGIVLAHADRHEGVDVTTNTSRAGRYLAVTVTIEAVSKDQLDRIYRDLSDCEHVRMVL